MRFGWLSLSLSPAREQDNLRIHQIIAQVQEAEALGFNSQEKVFITMRLFLPLHLL
jgi:hypothetical protein